MSGRQQKTLVQPINAIFRYLQSGQKVSLRGENGMQTILLEVEEGGVAWAVDMKLSAFQGNHKSDI